MTRGGRSGIVAGLVVTALALSGPISSAAASAAGIKHAFSRYAGRILVSEGHVVEAIETYKTSHEADPVVKAIEESQAVLGELRTKVEHQGAPGARVRRAKREIVAGLGGIISAYGRLSTAFSEQAGNPEGAKAEAAVAEEGVKKAQKELRAGVRLIGG
jgi:hypothetical protein